MAKKKLKGIIWPNLPNDEYILDADKVEYDDTETYSEGSVGDALQNKANIDGSYENLTAGNAEQIVTDIRANDQTPYLFRTAGGSVDIGDREYINGIVGGTVAWNQLAQRYGGTTTTNEVTFTFNADGSITVNGTADGNARVECYNTPQITNHIYYFAGCPKGGSNDTYRMYSSYWGATLDTGDGKLLKSAQTYASKGEVFISSGYTANNLVFKPQVFDLTLMFGSTIADYIYSLEQANAGAGVAFFKTLFPKPYYAYNAGELMSVKGLVSHDMVGFNAFDKSTAAVGKWLKDDFSGDTQNVSGYNVSDFIKVVPNATYYKTATGSARNLYYDADKNVISSAWEAGQQAQTFTVPPNARYARFTITDEYLDIACINLSWDGSEDGNYEPYQKWSYPLDSDLELRGIPKIENGNLYYDGDVYEADGTVTRKYGIVDLGTLDYTYQALSGSRNGFSVSLSELKETTGGSVLVSAICPKYRAVKYNDSWVNGDMSYFYPTGKTLVFINNDYTDATAFKTAMSGVYLVYELATPTTETADPYTSPQIVNDFGTEEFVISNTVAVPIPVGHNTDYPVNLKAKVEMMPNSPDGDGDYIVRQTNGTNEYVALANNATIQNILARLEALEGENNG